MMIKLRKMSCLPVLGLVLACGISLLTALGSALADDPGREPVSICGEVDLTTFQGTATVAVGGNTLSGTVAVIPMLPPEPKDGGLYFPEVIHVFDLGDDGSLTTLGAELAMPTDENPAVSTLHGNMVITAGTGVFEGASGELRVNGQMDWSLGLATFEAHGAISR